MRALLLCGVLAALLLPSGGVLAQPRYTDCGYQPHRRFVTLDTVRYVVSYSYSTYRDPAQPAERDRDEVWLEIGDSATKQYSRPRWVNDSIVHVQLSKGARNYRPLHQWCMREEIFYNAPGGGQVLWCYQDLVYNKAHAWFEPIPRLAWRLEEGVKDLIGYSCRKARLDYRGRRYTAWYTPAIPLPYGPWSFHGLPGLILEIRDDTDRVAFVANWFARARRGVPLAQYAGYYVRTTRKKVRKLIDFMHRQPYIYAGDMAEQISGEGWGPKREYKHTWVELE